MLMSRRYRFTIFIVKCAIIAKLHITHSSLGFPGGSDGKESACDAEDLGLIPWLESFPWRRGWQPIPVLSPGESPWTEEPGWLLWGCKKSDTIEQHTSYILNMSWFDFYCQPCSYHYYKDIYVYIYIYIYLFI